MIRPTTSPDADSGPEELSRDAFRALLGEGRLGQVFDYWTAKRNEPALPSRDDIDPAELTRLLPWLYLLEPVAAGMRVRLAGTRIRELFDRELTGSELIEALPQPFSGNAARSYRAVVEQKRGWLTIDACHLDDGKVLTYRRLSLPLSQDGQRVDRVLGVVDWNEGLTGSRPFWEVYEETLRHERREALCLLA